MIAKNRKTLCSNFLQNELYDSCCQYGIEYCGCDYCEKGLYQNKFIQRIKQFFMKLKRRMNMSKKGNAGLITIGIIAVVIAISAIWYAGTYNSLIQKAMTVNTLWSQVETQYQRRADLIPNLANSTKGYILHEQKVFDDIAQARTHYAGATTINDKVKASNEIESALARLLVIIENYPNLKADATVRALMDELAGTENRVNIARQRYNEGVQDYNTVIKIFPVNYIANKYNFKEKIFFVSEQGSEKAPVVNLEVNK